jgi:hypothetical protein
MLVSKNSLRMNWSRSKHDRVVINFIWKLTFYYSCICWYYTLRSVRCSSDVCGTALCSVFNNTEADSQRYTPVSDDPPTPLLWYIKLWSEQVSNYIDNRFTKHAIVSIYSKHSIVIDGNLHIVEVRWALQYMTEQLRLIWKTLCD